MHTARSILLAGLAAVLASIGSRACAIESVWARVPPGLSGDSLSPALRQLEAAGPRAMSAGAAYALGQFHFARGEYRLSAAAFGRAAARLDGADRADARYRQGLSWLGEREPGRARAAFEEVAMLSASLRPLALFGLAQSFALSGESDHELETLRRLLQSPAGEAEPAALERYAVLCERAHRAADAAGARERLLRRWPRSFEAALAARPASARAEGSRRP